MTLRLLPRPWAVTMIGCLACGTQGQMSHGECNPVDKFRGLPTQGKRSLEWGARRLSHQPSFFRKYCPREIPPPARQNAAFGMTPRMNSEVQPDHPPKAPTSRKEREKWGTRRKAEIHNGSTKANQGAASNAESSQAKFLSSATTAKLPLRGLAFPGRDAGFGRSPLCSLQPASLNSNRRKSPYSLPSRRHMR